MRIISGYLEAVTDEGVITRFAILEDAFIGAENKSDRVLLGVRKAYIRIMNLRRTHA